MDKKFRLTDIDIQFISLCKAPKTGERAILKAEDIIDDPSSPIVYLHKPEPREGQESQITPGVPVENFGKVVGIEKADKAKQLIYAILYPADKADSDDDFAEPADIEKALHTFMKARRLPVVDLQHNRQEQSAYVAELWMIRKGDPVFPDKPEGSLAAAIKIEDAALWEKYEKGELTGVSIGGEAYREPVVVAKSEEEKARLPLLKRIFKSIFATDVMEAKEPIPFTISAYLAEREIRDTVYDAHWAFQNIAERLVTEKPPGWAERLKAVFSEFMGIVADTPIIKSEEEKVMEKDLTAIQKAIEEVQASTNGLVTRVEALEAEIKKAETLPGETPEQVEAAEKLQSSLAEIKKAQETLAARLEKVEKARQASLQAIADAVTITPAADPGTFTGILT